MSKKQVVAAPNSRKGRQPRQKNCIIAKAKRRVKRPQYKARKQKESRKETRCPLPCSLYPYTERW